jgi:hypothetical protein
MNPAEIRPQPVEDTCGEAGESVEVPRCPVEQSVGPEECGTFFGEPLAHLSEQGIELSHRSTRGLAARLDSWGDRGSGRSEDPHHEATRGVGPVTGSAGSESQPGRGGCHPASSHEGLLVLIPSRDPHLASASGSALPVPAAETESQPACRRGRGSRVATGSAVGESGNPGRRRLRPEAAWIRTTAGLPEVERAPDSNERSTPRGNSWHRPGDGGGGDGRSWTDEVGVITTSTRGPLGAHTIR